jgi:hypothetical protein
MAWAGGNEAPIIFHHHNQHKNVGFDENFTRCVQEYLAVLKEL